MPFGFQGRERPWDITLLGTDGVTSYPFTIFRVKDVPQWSVRREPDIAGQAGGTQDIEQAYRSTHSGFGWGQYQPNTYHYGTSGVGGTNSTGGCDCRFPQQAIVGPLVTTLTLSSTNSTVGVTGIFEKNSKIYTISGKYVNEIDPATDAVSAAGGFPYDLTTGNAGAIGTVGVPFDGNVIIGMTTASAANMVSFSGTSTFTVLTDGSPPADGNVPKGAYLARYYADTDWVLAAMFLSGSNPSVAWIAQGAALGTTENWTGYAGDYGVSDQSATMSGLCAVDRTLFPGMSDGAYYVEGQAQRAPLLIPAMPRASTNGVNIMATDEGNVIYPCASGLYLYDPNNGTIDNIAPGRGLPDRSGIFGTYTAIASFRAWTFVAVYDGTHSYIMAGRRREENEPGFGPYIWHGALAKIASTKVTSMFVSSLVSPPRLWLGLLSGNVAYIKLPSNGDNPLLDSANYRYAASGSLYYGADDFGIGGMRWNLEDVILEAEGLDANTTVQIWERRDLNSGTAQVETATVLGTIGPAGAGNATVIVTAANMSGTPKTVSVAVANDDTASQVATKIRTTLAADVTVGAFFSVSGSGANVVLTVKSVVANDATMNISIANGTCSGLTTAATSSNTTAGVDSWVSVQTVSSNGRTAIATTGDKRFSRAELRLDITNGSSGSTPVIRVLAGHASRRPVMRDVISTTVILSDEMLSRLGIQTRYSAQDLLTQLKNLDVYSPTTLTHWWTGSESTNTVLLTALRPRVAMQEGDKAVGMVADLEMKVKA